VRLSVSVSGATLTVTFAGETMARKYTLPYDAAAVAQASRAVVEVLARGNRARTLSDKNLEDLKHHGEQLWRALIPTELQADLARGDTLALELDEALVAVPWELMFDGAHFLCRRLSIGRIVATRQPRRGDERRTVGTPIRVLVMASDPKSDLPEVRAEGEAIIDELEKHATVKARLSTAPDRAFALRYLKDYDLVHFAGHADYVAAEPGTSGWTLADGKLTADEIVKLGGGRPMPMIVFGNACQSGHTAAWDGDTRAVFGLANAFLTAGVRHYIGTQWEVVDGQSALFAGEFYRHLTDGKAIGAAVRHARAAVVERAGETALAWASYVLYGDPDVRPLHRPEHKRKLSIPSALEIAARASAPWKRPAATGARAVGGAIERVERRLPAWVPAALGGIAAGLVGVTVAAWLMHRKPAPLGGQPTLAGVAVLPLSTGDSANDQSHARDLEGCLPLQLSTDHVAVVPPEKMMTLQAQTNGVYDKASARAFGLAVGAKWVLFGNVVGGVAHLTVAEVVNDRAIYEDRFRIDDPRARCVELAAATAARLAAEPANP
jgi:CHAT domain-containing protein